MQGFAPAVGLLTLIASSAPRAQEAPPVKRAYFGETHVHTSYSLDAYIGGTRLTPRDSFRFAKGEPVEVLGRVYRISRPLDFAAVTDHAEYIGEMYSAMVEGAPGHEQELLEELRGLTELKDKQTWFAKYVVDNNRGDDPQHPPFFVGPETTKSAWRLMIDAAEEHNRPGEFTAFIAYEWSAAPKGANLHRNIIFRDSKVPELPMSAYEIPREEALWTWLESLEARGMRALAIPHNSNAGKSLMFPDKDSSGKPIDAEYARLRAHFEPLIEIMQIKGASEVHRSFWAQDEFAGFENADSLAKYSGRTLDERNFVRWGLGRGLAFEQSLGTNPFRLGFAGGTDNHNGLPSDVEEYDWNGGHGPEDGSVERRRTAEVGGWADGQDLNPGSLTGVWATENSRGALWDAMMARETFATSGTRIQVRLFGGSELTADPKDPRAMAAEGYARGVPMGGTLVAGERPPTFTVYALKDPDGANLDRTQIIKCWVDAAGGQHEKIVDVAWSQGRERNESGALPLVGDTVDLEEATYENSIGSPQLIGSWTDPDFDPARHALYYARALEIPTPRWSTYDAVRAGLPLLPEVPATVQERAWSSPIWFAPSK